MNIERVVKEARKSISNFCIEECKAYCCRKGCLTLTSKEVDLITHGKTKEFEVSGTIVRKEGESYVLDLGRSCPSLKNFKCVIHNNPERPSICKEFPIFIKDRSISFSQGCPAVRKKLFYPYEKQFLKLGYKLTSLGYK